MGNLLFRTYAACFAALFTAITSLGAQVNVAVVFDRTGIETGDTFTMRVLVSGTSAKPDRVDFSTWSDIVPTENILRRSGWVQSSGRWVSEYTLIVFDAVDMELPPLSVLSLAGEKAASNPVPIKITATPAPDDIEKMETVRGIREERWLWTDYTLILGLVLAFYVLYRYFIQKKKPAPVKQVMPESAPAIVVVKPAHETALQKLKKLEQQQPWKSGNVKGYYADLSHILKEYVESRYHVPALESTTREVEILLKKIPLKEGWILTLSNVLRQTDLAKYAHALHADKPHEQYLLKAEEFVHKTSAETI